MLSIWFNQHYRFPIASFLFVVNAFIFTIAAVVYTLEQAMLSLAVFYIVTKMINYVLDGLNHGKSVMIISEKPDEVGDSIISHLNINITFLYGEGGFFKGKKEGYLLYYKQVSFFQFKKCRFSDRSISYYGGVLCL